MVRLELGVAVPGYDRGRVVTVVQRFDQPLEEKRATTDHPVLMFLAMGILFCLSDRCGNHQGTAVGHPVAPERQIQPPGVE